MNKDIQKNRDRIDAIDNQDKDKLESFFRDAKTTRDSWVG